MYPLYSLQGGTVDIHDYVFWCGDLNYRVDLPTTAAKDYISHARWDKLNKQDQLFKQKRAKKVRIVFGIFVLPIRRYHG